MMHSTYARVLRAVGVAMLWALAVCGAMTAAPADTAPAQIVIKDFMFQPMSLSIKAGTTVSWLNRDDEPHTVRSNAGLFRSEALDTNESFSLRFDKPGTYHFTCSLHPRMTGTIIVQ